MNLFFQAFWAAIFEEWRELKTVHVNSDDEYFALLHEFFKNHEDQFVREYASTSIYEDLADSFMHFVLDPKPTGNSIIEKKILFFYDFPELVTLRQQMIQNVCSYTQE